MVWASALRKGSEEEMLWALTKSDGHPSNPITREAEAERIVASLQSETVSLIFKKAFVTCAACPDLRMTLRQPHTVHKQVRTAEFL